MEEIDDVSVVPHGCVSLRLMAEGMEAHCVLVNAVGSLQYNLFCIILSVQLPEGKFPAYREPLHCARAWSLCIAYRWIGQQFFVTIPKIVICVKCKAPWLPVCPTTRLG